jgi:hypothetical protein
LFWSYQSISPVPTYIYLFRKKASHSMRNCLHLAQIPTWRTIPCWLSATSYLIYSQLPSILEAVRPPATWGNTMSWWQGPTYDGIQIYLYKISVCSIGQNVTKFILTIPSRIQFGNISFLLKKSFFNILSDIVSNVTSFDFVVFVVRRRLVLPNFGELQ